MTSFDVSPLIPKWTLDEEGRVIAHRQADLWHREGRRVACDLCFRRCRLKDGQLGWCRARANRGGEMELLAHGVTCQTVRSMNGYKRNPFMFFRPGAKTLIVGGIHCTSGCTFCTSMNVTWHPERMPWMGHERCIAEDGARSGYKAMLHPAGAIYLAKQWGCASVTFAGNEPLCTFEWTHDTAMLAKQAGLDVLLATSGLSTVAAVRKLAKYVDAVDIGLKGSGGDDFYRQHMKAPGGMEAVKQSALAWRAAGVHVMFTDVVSPGSMDGADDFRAVQQATYSWIAENIGQNTPLGIATMQRPSDTVESEEPMVSGEGLAAEFAYINRVLGSHAAAKAAGLWYTTNRREPEGIRCHACKQVLLAWHEPRRDCDPCTMPTDFCPYWGHEAHVTDGHCDFCSAQVPIVTMED